MLHILLTDHIVLVLQPIPVNTDIVILANLQSIMKIHVKGPKGSFSVKHLPVFQETLSVAYVGNFISFV